MCITEQRGEGKYSASVEGECMVCANERGKDGVVCTEESLGWVQEIYPSDL